MVNFATLTRTAGVLLTAALGTLKQKFCTSTSPGPLAFPSRPGLLVWGGAAATALPPGGQPVNCTTRGPALLGPGRRLSVAATARSGGDERLLL